MPKSKKKSAKRGNKSLLSDAVQHKNRGFELNQSRHPKGLKTQATRGGKPKLFPGRTGGR